MKHRFDCICVKCEDARMGLRAEAGEMAIELARWIVDEWEYNDRQQVIDKAQAILDKLAGDK